MVRKLNLKIGLLIVLFCSIEVLAAAKYYKAEDDIKLPILDKKFNYKVAAIKHGDVNGDSKIEEVLLLAGKKAEEDEESYSRLSASRSRCYSTQ